MSARLFDVHVFSRFQREQCRRSVPVIGRGHNHGIERFVIQRNAEVLARLGRFAANSIDGRGSAVPRPALTFAGYSEHAATSRVSAPFGGTDREFSRTGIAEDDVV